MVPDLSWRQPACVMAALSAAVLTMAMPASASPARAAIPRNGKVNTHHPKTAIPASESDAALPLESESLHLPHCGPGWHLANGTSGYGCQRNPQPKPIHQVSIVAMPIVTTSASSAPAQAPVQPAGSPQQIAMSMLADFGWDSGQFSCLDSIWSRESGWDVTASNPNSGAYGIPQALPGSKMASAGADWQTDAATQIRWGLGYIQATYGSPCNAWAFWQAHSWY
jgi:hypothetical protein